MLITNIVLGQMLSAGDSAMVQSQLKSGTYSSPHNLTHSSSLMLMEENWIKMMCGA